MFQRIQQVVPCVEHPANRFFIVNYFILITESIYCRQELLALVIFHERAVIEEGMRVLQVLHKLLGLFTSSRESAHVRQVKYLHIP